MNRPESSPGQLTEEAGRNEAHGRRHGHLDHAHERDHDHDKHDHGHGDHHDHNHDHGHEHPGGLKGLLHGLFVPHSHDAADSVDEAMESSAKGIRALKISLAVLLVTSLLQLAVFVISGSVALLADTIHNFSDALTAVPLWVAFILSRRTATRAYNYGFGRAEDLAGLFIIAMVALSAIVAAVESVGRIFQPQPLSNLGWVLAAGLIGFAGNEIVAVYRIRVGKEIGSAALVADGVHARTDGFTSLAVVAGVIGVWLGFPLADPIIGILISAAIFVLLWGTARDIGRRLLDGVDPDLLGRVESAIAPVAPAESTVKLRWSGHRLHVEVTSPVDPHWTMADLGSLKHRVEEAVRTKIRNIGTVTVIVS
ncbi:MULTISPECIES: cation diffusion facilitator family transporter [unclassified Paenarthrobacter]|uniref:cation diffusion facilitator family transporter n=1 Tax=unclassified Paenarthrobacter TaxID=2634190 RepID=UPI001F3587DB|nr:cation diffusion facilitator family transporter [Paenarthrobacter sp. AR 02]MCF3138242.1 cation diffusion facilitator family transporter [Paenarthrobacter sp. AR 02]